LDDIKKNIFYEEIKRKASNKKNIGEFIAATQSQD